MPNAFRRYEFLLPLRFNNGTAVPDEMIGQTLIDLRTRFGAASSETQVIQGYWEHLGQVYRDELVRIFVDVADTPDNRKFFVELKQALMSRFDQLDIWMTSHTIDVL